MVRKVQGVPHGLFAPALQPGCGPARDGNTLMSGTMVGSSRSRGASHGDVFANHWQYEGKMEPAVVQRCVQERIEWIMRVARSEIIKAVERVYTSRVVHLQGMSRNKAARVSVHRSGFGLTDHRTLITD